MAIQAGRVGVDPRDVTLSGRIKGGGDIPPNVLTKEEAARIYQTILGMANYLTKVEASELYQTISDMVNYQAKLVSGTNIKRINGEDLLGSGNISVLTNEIASGIYQTIQGMSSYALKSELPDTSDMLTKTEAPGYDDILTQTQADELFDEKMDLAANPINNNILLTDSTGQAKTGSKKLSDLQEVLTVGTGIDITNNVISNQFATLVNPDLDTIKYNYQGYLYGGTNTPSGASAAGMLCSIFRKGTTDRGLQIYVPYNSDKMFYRRCSASTFNPWRLLSDCYMVGDTYSPRDNIVCGYGYISNGQARLTITLPKPVTASNVSLSGNIRVNYGSGITTSKSISSYTYTTSLEANMSAIYLNISDFNTIESLSLGNGTLLMPMFGSMTFTFS